MNNSQIFLNFIFFMANLSFLIPCVIIGSVFLANLDYLMSYFSKENCHNISSLSMVYNNTIIIILNCNTEYNLLVIHYHFLLCVMRIM